MTSSNSGSASFFFLPLPPFFLLSFASLSYSSSFFIRFVLYLLNRLSNWSSSLTRSLRLSRFLFLTCLAMTLSSSVWKTFWPGFVFYCSFLRSFSSRLRNSELTFCFAEILAWSFEFFSPLPPSFFWDSAAAAASCGFFRVWIFFLIRCFLPLAIGYSSMP